MRRRDLWLFATIGWDPTWQRRVPRRVKVVWTIALILVGASLGALAVIGMIGASRPKMLLMLAIMVLGTASLSIIQHLVRREVMGRLDSEQDERAAQQIQARLVPSTLPDIHGVELAGHYSPFRLVSGDYYDVMRLSDRLVLIAMADVSGKGPAAALLTANLQALLHFSQLREQPPDQVVRGMNEHLVRYTEISRYVTMVLGVYDLESHRLRYVNAGHLPPIGVAPSGEVLRLDATGPAMGWFDTAEYACREVEVPPGTTLLFYTDGLSERTNIALDQYGIDRIASTLRSAGPRPARETLDIVLADVDRFAGRATPEDDTALLVLRAY